MEIEAAPNMEVQIPAMSEDEFYWFCAANADLRIERERDGKITIRLPVCLLSGFQKGEIGGELFNWNKATNSGKTFSSSAGFTLPDTAVISADAAWISRKKWKNLPWLERNRFGHVVPDFIVEVRSFSDSLKKLKEKVTGTWLANGVQLAWLIDPVQQKAYIFRADGSEQMVEGFDKKLSGENVLPGFEFDLSLLLDEDD